MSTAFATQQSAENWDEDFEFESQAGSPPVTSSHLPPSNTRQSAAISNFPNDWGDAEPIASTSSQRIPSTSTGVSTRSGAAQSAPEENWDDDFEDKLESPGKKTPKKRTYRQHAEEPENWDEFFEEDDDDDEGELGFADKDEDRTVTARSKRGSTSHSAAIHSTPPPPVPPIPFSLLSQQETSHHEQPFPRSPAASVFSAPSVGSGRDSVAFSYYHNNSTTHLRPTVSRSTLGGLSNLPPSPPIHKERERRRLRKKSRPHPEAVYEMVDRQTSSDVSLESENHVPSETPPPPSTPPPSNPTTQAQAISTPSGNRRNSVNLNFSPPILSRIGSVKKKWAVRKKRASSTPSEVSLHELDKNTADTSEDPREHTPRPPSSSGRPGWFFRPSTQGNQPNDQTQVANGTGLSEESPSKLMKRKSFGFVQIRRGKGPLNEGATAQISSSDLPSDLKAELDNSPRKKSRHLSQQVRRPSGQQNRGQSRHASYGGDGAAKKSTESLALQRQRKRSVSRCSSRETTNTDQSDKDGRRGFMGSMRRISLIGKHQRAQSTASSTGSISSPPPLPQRPDQFEDHDDDEPAGMKTPSKSRSQALLPPIELQPPSPPRLPSLAQHSPLSLEPVFAPPKAHSQRSPSPTSKAPSSLGRAALGHNSSVVPRRNSLGDLKIPARISQAQVGLKRDLGLVRDFALEIEQLKELQSSYNSMMSEVQVLLDAQLQAQSQSRAVSPEPRDMSKPKSSRGRSNTGATATPSLFQPAYKHLATSFYTINSKYRMVWECAELLIELGSGSTAASPGSPPSSSTSAPAIPIMTRSASAQSRDLIMTMNGDGGAGEYTLEYSVLSRSTGPPLGSPPTLGWRASTGRHDLSQRQLMLLREMLNNNPESSFVADEPPQAVPIPEEAAKSTVSVNRDWHWGDPIGSTVTLASEDDSQIPVKRPSKLKGFRDMLRLLKKHTSTQASSQMPPIPVSQSSLHTDSSMDSHPYSTQPNKITGRRRAKTSSGPEEMTNHLGRPTSPYMALNKKASPRRPSLASIFRIGQKHKTSSQASGSSLGQEDASSRSASRVSSNIADDEDWDRLDKPNDAVVISPSSRKEASTGTVRGRSPYLQAQLPAGAAEPVKPPLPSTSQTSLWAEMSARPIRLSNVEEAEIDVNGTPVIQTSATPSRQPSRSRRGGKTGSVRSMPPQQSDAKLAMTPENIKPLLDNAREVHSRLKECIAEIRALMEQHHSS